LHNGRPFNRGTTVFTYMYNDDGREAMTDKM
jgi:hypothetical protein